MFITPIGSTINSEIKDGNYQRALKAKLICKWDHVTYLERLRRVSKAAEL